MKETVPNMLRADKWLWFTRFFKTRALAAKAVRGGHVRINGSRAKPSSSISPGDVVQIVRNQLTWRVTARDLPFRRGPAVEAKSCYEEDAATAAARKQLIEVLKTDRLQLPRTDGRPDKRTRRILRDRKQQ